MARKKQYATAADRQAAYRERRNNVTNVTPEAPPAIPMIVYKRTIGAIQTLLEYERMTKGVIVTRIGRDDDEVWNLYLGPMVLGSYATMNEAIAAEKALGRIERGEV